MARSTHAAALEPEHLTYTLTNSNQTGNLHGTAAFDPRNQEAENAMQGR